MIPVMILAMLIGPAAASILLTEVVSGRAGYRELLSRLVGWRVGIGSYIAALLTAPVVLTTVPLTLSLWSRQFMARIFTESGKGSVLLMGFVVGGAVAACFEELGWTGFVIPRFRFAFWCLWYCRHRWHSVGNMCHPDR